MSSNSSEKDYSNIEEDDQLLRRGRSNRSFEPSSRKPLAALVVLSLVYLVTLPLAYYVGLRNGNTELPKLPSDVFTKGSVHMELTKLDDEFELATLEQNQKFQGKPRDELDQAWSDILKGINLRIPKEVAKQINFTSIEITADGSGDIFGTPAVFHNLHCLKSIRQSMFPERYPDNWKTVKPQENGELSEHMDHCIETLRRSIMCQGDMSLYSYFWRDWTTRPGVTMKSPHVCANFEKLQEWSIDHSFSIYDGLLEHPKFGKMDPLHFVGANGMPEGQEGHEEHN